jgi:hypothetical protein
MSLYFVNVIDSLLNYLDFLSKSNHADRLQESFLSATEDLESSLIQIKSITWALNIRSTCIEFFSNIILISVYTLELI